jgi:hypothetical protein
MGYASYLLEKANPWSAPTKIADGRSLTRGNQQPEESRLIGTPPSCCRDVASYVSTECCERCDARLGEHLRQLLHVVVFAGPLFGFIQFAEGLVDVVHGRDSVAAPLSTGMLGVRSWRFAARAVRFPLRRARPFVQVQETRRQRVTGQTSRAMQMLQLS